MENNDSITILMIAFSIFFFYGLVSLLFLVVYIIPVANFFLLTLFILLTSLLPMLVIGIFLKFIKG